MKEYKRWDNVTCYEPEMSDLVGRTFSEVFVRDNDEEMVFVCEDGNFIFRHYQDCCESVSINDIVGDLSDLVGSPILRAEESVGESEGNDYGSQTWTFYKFATAKGYVDVRWFGESNGYYSESVNLDFEPSENYGS